MNATNALEIIEAIRDLISGPVTTVVPGVTLNLDEPINLVYTDLPSISIYPLRDDYQYEESFGSADKMHLQVRVELRMKSGPASTVCTPVVNAICAAIKADARLGGLATYVEIQSIQWGNDTTGSGAVCGAAIDIQVQYLL